MGIGTVTDAYQPIEDKYRITRKCLEALLKNDWPVSIQTKSPLVLRDVDLIKRFSDREVGFTITCIDDSFRKIFEPGSAPVDDRLAALKKLNEEGIRTWVFIGPVLPFVTEEKIENLIDEVAKAGTRHVIVDRLRLKPGIPARIQAAVARYLPEIFPKFKAKMGDLDYFRAIKGQIQRLCKVRDLRCEMAFPELPAKLGR